MEYNLDLVEESMTSLQLAEISNRRHDNLMRDIEQMFKEADLTALKFEVSYKDASGRENKMYALDKRKTLFVVSQFNHKLRNLIIDKLFELRDEINEKDKRILELEKEKLRKLEIENKENIRVSDCFRKILLISANIDRQKGSKSMLQVKIKIGYNTYYIAKHEKRLHKQIKLYAKYILEKTSHLDLTDEEKISIIDSKVDEEFEDEYNFI